MSVTLRPLADQVVVITGASSGIGLVTARMAARRGARLVLAARNSQALRTLCEEIEADGGGATYVVADVGNEDDVARIARTAVATYGRFDTWVNNAGVSIFGHIEDVSIRDMHRVFDTVFWGVVHGSLAAVRHYRDRGDGAGALINIGSFFGDRATPLQSTYASAKFAVHGFTEALRVELAAEHAPVSVTLVHPGRIDTPYNEHAHSYIEQQPAHRGMIYPPEAVAEAILFAAEHPKRDLYVGSQAKLLLAAANVAPKLVDAVMKRYGQWSQHSDRPSRPRTQSALYQPGYGLHERGTHEGHVRARSYYVKAATHPAVTAGAALAVAGTAAALALHRRTPGRRRPAARRCR
jgi:short-subunit dehydrogenase